MWKPSSNKSRDKLSVNITESSEFHLKDPRFHMKNLSDGMSFERELLP